MSKERENIGLFARAERLSRAGDLHSRWPLPLALVLAILLWMSLHDKVEKSTVSICHIVRDAPIDSSLENLKSQALTLRLPQTRTSYKIDQLLDANNQVMDPSAGVTFNFKGPGKLIRKVAERLQAYVDIPRPKREDQNEYEFQFKAEDIRTVNQELSDFFTSMHPSLITVKLVASGKRTILLNRSHVRINYHKPVNEWEKRIFTDSMQFNPKKVTLYGPNLLLQRIGKEPKIFVMDCENIEAQLANAIKNNPSERPKLSFNLKLASNLQGLKRTKSDEDLTVSVEVAPAPTRFPISENPKDAFILSIQADWKSSKLSAENFLVSDNIKIQILSYNEALDDLLKKGGKVWVKRWLRAVVDMGEIDQNFKNSADQKEFRDYLSAKFLCFEEQYKLGKDFEINALGFIEVKPIKNDQQPKPGK